MKGNPEERAVALAEYIIEQNSTVRKAAATFMLSKSTVHKDHLKIAGTFHNQNVIFLWGGALV